MTKLKELKAAKAAAWKAADTLDAPVDDYHDACVAYYTELNKTKETHNGTSNLQ
jgi:hypothetical protein